MTSTIPNIDFQTSILYLFGFFNQLNPLVALVLGLAMLAFFLRLVFPALERARRGALRLSGLLGRKMKIKTLLYISSLIIALHAALHAAPALAQTPCATPTEYQTRLPNATLTPIATWTPLPTPTAFDYSLPVTHPVVVMDTQTVSITDRLTETFETAYTILPSMALDISDTAIIAPVNIIAGFATELTFWFSGFAVLMSMLLFRLVVLTLLASVRQTQNVKSGVSGFIEMIQNVLSNVPSVVKWGVLLLPIVLYACNAVF